MSAKGIIFYQQNGVIKTKKYAELFDAEKIQVDCDMKATNIILQGLPADIYSLVNHHRVAKDLWERVQLLMQVVGLALKNGGLPRWKGVMGLGFSGGGDEVITQWVIWRL
ncbi:hypothetical protein Tco_0680873 [Tanacetum coccineum]|uniref:Integrase, catalytic region, zinc finger, CCHC-type, peptidase aspartic, catalytic n=1 Tax=Tanacetum coccineum TaxID=301880 RepID=A0ABQ4XLR5_9ASTR